jgi:hypothetical protein
VYDGDVGASVVGAGVVGDGTFAFAFTVAD